MVKQSGVLVPESSVVVAQILVEFEVVRHSDFSNFLQPNQVLIYLLSSRHF